MVVTQLGTAATDSLTVSFLGHTTTIDSLTVNDAVLALNPVAVGAISSLIDGGATNTLTTIKVLAGGSAAEVGGITDTALTTIDTTAATALVTLGDVTALSQAGLTITAGQAATQIGAWTLAGVGSKGLSGTGDKVTIGTSVLNNINSNEVLASGSGAQITIDGNGANVITANGVGDTITVGDSVNGVGANIIVATGANDKIVFLGTQTGNATTKVGSNAIVTFGNGGGTNDVTVTGDVTGGTSADFAFVTLNNVATSVGEKLTFDNSGGTEKLAGGGGSLGGSLVNVASATTLAGALDLAASEAAKSQVANPADPNYQKIGPQTGVLDWFQFAGNTYIAEAVNTSGQAAGHTALGANDAVVKISGLVNLTDSTFSGHTLSI